MSRKNTIKKSLDFSRSDHMDIALSMLMSSSESEQSDNSFMLDNNRNPEHSPLHSPLSEFELPHEAIVSAHVSDPPTRSETLLRSASIALRSSMVYMTSHGLAMTTISSANRSLYYVPLLGKGLPFSPPLFPVLGMHLPIELKSAQVVPPSPLGADVEDLHGRTVLA
ncbi:hypothetical protein MSG28_007199 [Choristoneura fumiferana]|uniref:Uncharacterized protein n=1 Tax=Choristoneura fumiferana TaxID=7141 RepID=A0ACC0JN18_CHOFU|nr:hypothetical protein MSG28_007199 [Choristoneura fumiferana]